MRLVRRAVSLRVQVGPGEERAEEGVGRDEDDVEAVDGSVASREGAHEARQREQEEPRAME